MNGQMVKPGTVALFIFIAIVGFMSYTLVSDNIRDVGESADQDRQEAFECTKLDVEFLDVSESSNTTTVFFRTNDDLDGISLGTEGSNLSETIEGIEADTIYNVSLNVSEPDGLYIQTSGCPDPFPIR